MRRRALAAALCAASVVVVSPARAAETRYSVAGGCYTLRAQSGGQVIAPAAGPFRMQATALGRYLLFGRRGDFLADGLARVAQPGPATEWIVSDALTVTNASSGESLGTVSFEPATGCADYPEVEVNATGEPSHGETPYGEVRGLMDAHIHMFAFEAVGGLSHCGRPWHPYGVPFALPDCAQTQGPLGAAAPFQNFLDYGSPLAPHDTRGWPMFKDWPSHEKLSYEQVYYKWLERAWRGGLRVFVNKFVDNKGLCDAYPGLKKYGCNEMDSVRRQARDIRELQDYIDAQSGGPGKGWFRIVDNPFEARRVINAGKLAVVQSIETSILFDCGLRDDLPQCDRNQIDRGLDEVSRWGVRDLQLINKFDNAFGGVAGDNGLIGVVVNSLNKLETDRFWDLQTCTGPAEESDKEQMTLPGLARDSVFGVLQPLVPGGTLPVYPAPPHCNVRGLTDLGEYLIRQMMARGMIIDPDHLDVVSRKQVLTLLESKRYSGVVSSHSWSTSDAYPRIYRLGGIVSPYAGNSTSFVKAWRKLRAIRDKRFYFGLGYGADMNGLGAQGAPRAGDNPVRYPFKSFDGAVTLDRERTGTRVWDINKDGVAHYGLYPDWIEDLRMIAGDAIIRDMARGPEAYLEMWERAEGVPATRCQGPRAPVTRRAIGAVRVGDTPQEVLERAGQPAARHGTTFRWCVSGKRNGTAKVVAVFGRDRRVALVARRLAGHVQHVESRAAARRPARVRRYLARAKVGT